MEYILQTNQLTKKYGNKNVVDHISLNVKKGDIYGFVGKNGAGKTTVIRLITGIINKTSGSYSLFGKNDDEDLTNIRKNISAVVENPSIYLNMNAYDNMLMQAIILGEKKLDEIDRILKLVGLDQIAKDKKVAKNYSLGMRQRLGIALTLLGNPQFLILDEPTNGLDPEGIKEIRELLLKLNKEEGITIFISSHILEELEKLATCYGFIDDGKLLKEISAKQLEEECKKRVEIVVDNTDKLKETLEKLKIKEYKIEKDKVIIYDEIEITPLVLALHKAKINVLKYRELHENLESYFINLVGGNNND